MLSLRKPSNIWDSYTPNGFKNDHESDEMRIYIFVYILKGAHLWGGGGVIIIIIIIIVINHRINILLAVFFLFFCFCLFLLSLKPSKFLQFFLQGLACLMRTS